MYTHEDKLKINDTVHGGKLAREGRKAGKRHTNRKRDKFQKAQAKRG